MDIVSTLLLSLALIGLVGSAGMALRAFDIAQRIHYSESQGNPRPNNQGAPKTPDKQPQGRPQ